MQSMPRQLRAMLSAEDVIDDDTLENVATDPS